MFLQKISGLFITLFPILTAALLQEDTAGALFIPMGLYLMFTKKQVMYWQEVNKIRF